MTLSTKEEAEKSGWKVETGKDGKELKIIMEPGGYKPEATKREKKPEEKKMTTAETTAVPYRTEEPVQRTESQSEQVPTDFWIGITHSRKDLIMVLKGISTDENGNPVDRVFLANPRDVRDVINGDWSGARLRELIRRK